MKPGAEKRERERYPIRQSSSSSSSSPSSAQLMSRMFVSKVSSPRRGQRTRTGPLWPLDNFQMAPSWLDMHAPDAGMKFLNSHSNVSILIVGTDDTQTVKSMVDSSRYYALCRANPGYLTASSTIRAMLLWRGHVCGAHLG